MSADETTWSDVILALDDDDENTAVELARTLVIRDYESRGKWWLSPNYRHEPAWSGEAAVALSRLCPIILKDFT